MCTGCSTAVNDLVYIIDGSWSVGVSDFDTAKQWLINITSQFDISSHYTQVMLHAVHNENDLNNLQFPFRFTAVFLTRVIWCITHNRDPLR